MFYIYIIYSESSDKYYVGHTNNFTRRLYEHNNNPRITYTHKFGPWELKAYFPINEKRGDAVKIEKYIKRLKSRKIIERLINEHEYFNEIAQLVRVPTRRD